MISENDNISDSSVISDVAVTHCDGQPHPAKPHQRRIENGLLYTNTFVKLDFVDIS